MNFILFLLSIIIATALFWAVCSIFGSKYPFDMIVLFINTLVYGIALAYVVTYFSKSAEYRWLYYVFGGFIALSGNWVNLLSSRGEVKMHASAIFSLITLIIYVISIFAIL